MKNYLYYDCETSPESDAKLAALMPEFRAPANYKDPEKIAANIAEQRASWIKEAALNPVSGVVLTIGLLSDDGFMHLEGLTEAERIAGFWEVLEEQSLVGEAVGWCSHRFDLPFLIKRSWANHIKVPAWVRKTSSASGSSGRTYWDSRLVDLQDLWGLGESHPEGNLDQVARFLGVGSKSGNGGDFALLWKTDKAKALEYLENDLVLTKAIHSRIMESYARTETIPS